MICLHFVGYTARGRPPTRQASRLLPGHAPLLQTAQGPTPSLQSCSGWAGGLGPAPGTGGGKEEGGDNKEDHLSLPRPPLHRTQVTLCLPSLA